MDNNKLEPVLKDKIRLDIIFSTIVKNWRKFVIPLLATAVISSLLALCIPRYYSVKVVLAPEYDEGGGAMSGIGGLASLVGINVGGLSGSDAISPTFYPDLMASTDFLVPLLYSTVTTKDSTFTGRYMTYLLTQQKAPFWLVAQAKLIHLFKSPAQPLSKDPNYRANPFCLTKMEDELIRMLKGTITCSVDKKTEVITLTTTAQDPLVAALLADTVKQHLQNFITDYRTSKARIDLKHIEKLCEEARVKYSEAQQNYAEFIDSHRNITLESYKIVEAKYSNEMDLALNSYNALLQQKLLAEAKVQERTPAFTTLQNANVPVKHAGPKRMLGVLSLTFIAFIITSIVVVVRRKE